MTARSQPVGRDTGGHRPARIAMIGQKGLPATYGGVEHVVEHLGERLAGDGFDVTVYCRRAYSPNPPPVYKGMRLVVTPTVSSKHLDAIVHSVTSTVHALGSGADVVHYHGIGPTLAAWLPRLFGRKVVATVHGLDHERAKWSGPARAVLGLAHWTSGRVPNEVIAVSRALAEHYERTFGRRTHYISNAAAEPTPGPLTEQLRARHNLPEGRYVLFVGRVVPEKRPDLLVDIVDDLPEDVSLVIVGDSSFTGEYVSGLRERVKDNSRVRFAGFVYGADLGAIYSNASVFVQPSDLEGLPLTLLEALAYDIPVVASAIQPHVEVLGEDVPAPHVTFTPGDAAALSAAVRSVLERGDAARGLAASVRPRILAPYDWDAAAAKVAAVYERLGRRRSVRRAGSVRQALR